MARWPISTKAAPTTRSGSATNGAGTVTELGAGVDPAWLGRRVTGDTMIGCGACPRCLAGRHHVCANRLEIGIRGGFPGALAEQLAVPVKALLALPDAVDDVAGALVEPGGNAVRAVDAAALQPGERLLVLGAGSIGLLIALIARARGIRVQLVGRSARSIAFAASLGFGDAGPIEIRSGHRLGWRDRRVQCVHWTWPSARPGRAWPAHREHRPGRDAECHR